MEAVGGGPAANQRPGQVRQLGPRAQGPAGVVRRQRKGFDREDGETATLRARAAPELEQGQDIEAGPEAELADHEVVSPAPGVRQAAAGQEHGPGFFQAPLGGEIDVIEATRAGCAVLAPVEARPFSHRPQRRRAARGRPFRSPLVSGLLSRRGRGRGGGVAGCGSARSGG